MQVRDLTSSNITHFIEYKSNCLNRKRYKMQLHTCTCIGNITSLKKSKMYDFIMCLFFFYSMYIFFFVSYSRSIMDFIFFSFSLNNYHYHNLFSQISKKSTVSCDSDIGLLSTVCACLFNSTSFQ